MKPAPRPLIVSDIHLPGPLASFPLRTADEYLAGEHESLDEGLLVVNLCRSYQYLSKGYYVSLLAHARRQEVTPPLDLIEEVGNPVAYFRALQDAGIDTIDFKIVRGRGRRLLPKVIVLPDTAEPGPRSAKPLLVRGDPDALRYERSRKDFVEVTSIFGTTRDERFRRQVSAVYRVFPIPILRIRMYREDDRWVVGQIYPAAASQLDDAELGLLEDRLTTTRFAPRVDRGEPPRARIACLWEPDDPESPSDRETIERLARIALRRGVVVETIGRHDLPHLAEYDALFLRTVTSIDNHAFTFARVAESLGMPVIDDTQSIIRCSNKVYLHELFRRNEIATPRTRTLSRKTALDEVAVLGFPLIIKRPDGTFSNAVKKAADSTELRMVTQAMFRDSPLLIAQEFIPTSFDWRIGILEGRVLFVCRYHMVKDHWQIAQRSATGRTRFGRVEAVPIATAPEQVTNVALQAAALIGDGFYGVDMKETERGPVVIEINDNPNLELGYEDAVERDRVYEQIVDFFLQRLDEE